MNKSTQQSVLGRGHEFPWEKNIIERWRTMLSCLPKSSRRVLLDRQLKNPNHHYTLRREQGSKSALKSTNCNKSSHNLNNYLVTLMLQRIRDCTHRTRGREEKEKRMSSLLFRSFISKLAIASDVQKTEDCSVLYYRSRTALLHSPLP
jgi:dsDNA-specific endonuclease/ATPase MutS2